LGPDVKYDFNVTFLNEPQENENKFFMVTNVLADEIKVLNADLDFTTSSFDNIRLRNIEGGFDMTFKDYYSLIYNFPAGEGYLFQVAPVVLYGGKLVYSEDVGEGITLNDDMTIEKVQRFLFTVHTTQKQT
jgi:hypothetical protein